MAPDLRQLEARIQSIADEVATLPGSYTNPQGQVTLRTNTLNNRAGYLEEGNVLQRLTQLEQVNAGPRITHLEQLLAFSARWNHTLAHST
jgi:hypothetical protein